MEEKKKMKKIFFDNWNLLFRPEEEVLIWKMINYSDKGNNF